MLVVKYRGSRKMIAVVKIEVVLINLRQRRNKGSGDRES